MFPFDHIGGPLVDITNPENKTLIGLVSFGVTVINVLILNIISTK